MAVKTVTSNTASMRVMYTEGGEEVFKYVSLGSLVPGADVDKIVEVGDAIGAKLDGSYMNVRLSEYVTLTPDPVSD